jgi:Nuclease-related domain
VRADRNPEHAAGARPDLFEVPAPRREPYRVRTWATEPLGTAAVAEMLDGLRAYGVVAWHGARLRRPRTRVDHLVLAPSGVYVVAARAWTGRVELRTAGSELRAKQRLRVGGRDRTRVAHALVKDSVAVRRALGRYMVPVHAVLCIADGDWPLWAKPLELDGISVVWPKELERRVRQLGKLDGGGIDQLATHLTPKLSSRRS